ncbi:uncharacterized protein I206_101554 [Kwoniella pini CBS 10737]|uniref:Uncharacterized protein n=1 Tax=Kwoniella pini CBS 10737 TaxID=1296096 RepID=A0A1B9HWD0_9TREE|nr:uncharacterized protein I206_06474 [Kwoniella pini CBS 10737]OCF47571.1 hypothetical protein I206_06474 [Kwoniella pini CBS 10737]
MSLAVTRATINPMRSLLLSRQFTHHAGISTRYQSTFSKKTFPIKPDVNKASQTIKSTRLFLPRPVKVEVRSFIRSLDQFAALIDKARRASSFQKIQNPELRQAAKQVMDWSSGKAFPSQFAESVKNWSNKHWAVLTNLSPKQIIMVNNAYEIARRDAHSALRSKNLRPGFVSPPSFEQRKRGLNLLEQLRKLGEIKNEADQKSKAVRIEIEHVSGTHLSYLVTVRVSNAIRGTLVISYNQQTQLFQPSEIFTTGHGEGHLLTRHARTVLPKADPAIFGDNALQQDVLSKVREWILLEFPEFAPKSSRHSEFPVQLHASGNKSVNGHKAVTGRRGYRQTLSNRESFETLFRQTASIEARLRVIEAADDVYASLWNAKLNDQVVRPGSSDK